jgi:formamidopyrimidine-DNA glycosylase
MPELPEVETIRRQLSEKIVGQTIRRIEVRRVRCFVGSQDLNNEKIVGIYRTGKYLFVEFVSGKGLIIHLKMTGRLVHGVEWYQTAPHTRVVLYLDDNYKLYYWDARTFGYIKYEDEIMQKYQIQKKKLGPDPWEMSEADFYKLCQRFKRPIKNLILDQSYMAGVGNIYANDALWEAKIDPRRVSYELSSGEANKILKALRFVMERGLATGGASDNSYVDGLGNKGKYQDEFRVYKRTGEACLRCGEVIQRVVVGGRGSFVCTNCQH